MKLTHFILIGLVTFGFALSANAGAVADADGDGLPDPFDTCLNVGNGAGDVTGAGAVNRDSDLDGMGNRCDGDLDQDATVGGGDFLAFGAIFGTADLEGDFDGDNAVGGGDFLIFGALFGNAVGPSGLGCADATLMPPATCEP